MADLSINQRIKEAKRDPKAQLFTNHAADYIKKITDSSPKDMQKYSDHFDNFQEGLKGSLVSNKFNNLAKTLANRDWANFFKVYEAGFALEVQWAEMEA